MKRQKAMETEMGAIAGSQGTVGGQVGREGNRSGKRKPGQERNDVVTAPMRKAAKIKRKQMPLQYSVSNALWKKLGSTNVALCLHDVSQLGHFDLKNFSEVRTPKGYSL